MDEAKHDRRIERQIDADLDRPRSTDDRDATDHAYESWKARREEEGR